MRQAPAYFPTTFAALVGLVAATAAVFFSTPPAHARLVPPAVRAISDNKTETRPLSADARGISLNTADNVVVKQGNTPGISLTGPADELARTETVVEKGRLIIRKSGEGRMSWSKSDAVTITVTMPVVEALNLNGSGNLHTEGTLTGADLAISVAGSGDVRVTAEVSGTVATSIAGSGDVRLNGRCQTHTVQVAGSGNVRADELLAAKTSVKVSGSGDVSVAAADALDVTISGSGDVRYAGTPKNFVKNVRGSGTVVKM